MAVNRVMVVPPVIGQIRRFCPTCGGFTDSWMGPDAIEYCAQHEPPGQDGWPTDERSTWDHSFS